MNENIVDEIEIWNEFRSEFKTNDEFLKLAINILADNLRCQKNEFFMAEYSKDLDFFNCALYLIAFPYAGKKQMSEFLVKKTIKEICEKIDYHYKNVEDFEFPF